MIGVHFADQKWRENQTGKHDQLDEIGKCYQNQNKDWAHSEGHPHTEGAFNGAFAECRGPSPELW